MTKMRTNTIVEIEGNGVEKLLFRVCFTCKNVEIIEGGLTGIIALDGCANCREERKENVEKESKKE